VRTDQYGFRSPAIPEQAPPGTARIAFVGDSIMMGWGVAEKETMPAQVLEALKAQGRKVDGFNMGVGNYNTLQELALFKDRGLRLKPDIIVLGYFINDGEPMPSYNDVSWLERHSEAWVTLKYRIDTLMRASGEKPDWKQYYRDLYKDGAPGWKQTQQSLADFAKLAKEQGIQIIVFNIPELRELKPYAFPDVTEKVRKVVEANGMKFVDLLPSVENLDPPSLWVTVPDPHPNGKAEIAMSKQIAPDLIPLLDELCRSQGKGCAAK
jgi:lysophospholipase L1-like esterase